ncbi:major facilitator superfamily domain-containing protein [Cercophora newfieldiana]|uniref:Major facilitator superfamily domain-containing protein n=1 Tax=Cercophora newfieldiana TaxID=92897 RepID=A0AA39XQT7_9PEZI|nr:major facilitator superfamily domain-containing protein [Cercophora newfieldiana]
MSTPAEAHRKSSGSGSAHGDEKVAPQVSHTADSESGEGPKPHLHAKTYLAIFSICLIYFVQIYNIVGTGVLGNTIALTLGSPGSVVWLSSSIAIGTAVLSPIFSQAADYWGRRWLLVVSTFLGAVGSIIVARATSMEMAIAGCVVISISYGAQPLLHAISSEILPRRYRSVGQAADLVANGFGGIAALLISGAFVRTANVPSFNFRNFWYLGTALYAVSSLLCIVLYRPPPTELQISLTLSEKLARLDWPAYGLLTSGIILFCVGLSYSQNPFPWSDAHTSAPFAVGLALLVALAAYSAFLKKDGMLHHDLFKNRNFAIALVCLFCEGLAFFAANNYFAFQVGVLYETDALIVGTRYAIMCIVSIIAAAVAGAFVAKTKKLRWITVASFLLFVAFFAAMANMGTDDSMPVWGLPVLLGAGLGLSLVSLITLAQLSTTPELIATASGLVIGIRSLGGSVGLAIYNALFSNSMAKMGDNIAQAVLPLGLPPTSIGPLIGALNAHDDAAMFKIPGVTPRIVGSAAGALLETFASSFRLVWIAAACFVAFAAILSVFIKENTNEFNMHIDAPVEKEDELYASS